MFQSATTRSGSQALSTNRSRLSTNYSTSGYNPDTYGRYYGTTASMLPPPTTGSSASVSTGGIGSTAYRRPDSRETLAELRERQQTYSFTEAPQRHYQSSNDTSSIGTTSSSVIGGGGGAQRPLPSIGRDRVATLSSQLSYDETGRSSAAVQQPQRDNGGGSGASIIGFRNIGNTCYMNAALQCVLHATGGFVQRLERECREAPRSAPLSNALCSLYRGTTSELFSVKSAVAGTNRQFLGSAQNDAHEFLRELLHTVHREINRVRGKPKYVEMKDIPGEPDGDALQRWSRYCKSHDDSLVYDEFGGLARSVTKCGMCQFRSLSFDPILDLSVPMTGATSVADCISELYKVTAINAEYRCANCKKQNTGAAHQITVQLLPKQLVIHLKRFSSSGRKNGAAVAFDEVLDFPSISGTADGKYLLTGVVMHHGSNFGGHYTAYVRKGQRQEWVECDDSSVMSASSRHVLGATSAAYLLFYNLMT